MSESSDAWAMGNSTARAITQRRPGEEPDHPADQLKTFLIEETGVFCPILQVALSRLCSVGKSCYDLAVQKSAFRDQFTYRAAILKAGAPK